MRGILSTIVTDNGPQFVSSIFRDFLKERGIQHIRSSVCHPQANGCVERFNRVLKNCVQLADLQQKPWKPEVTRMLQIYRVTPHATTNATPFQLMRGRPLRIKLNILPICGKVDYRKVPERVAKMQEKSKQHVDKRRAAKWLRLKPGDRVRIRKPQLVKKGDVRFSTPVLMKRQVGPSTYVLGDGKSWNTANLAVCPEKEQMPTTVPQEKPNVEMGSPRKTRHKKTPGWLKDFVTA